MKNFLDIFPWVIMPALMTGFALQALKVIRTKQTASLSTITFLQALATTCMWLVNAFLAGEKAYPIGIANGFSMLFISVIIFYILHNLNKNYKWIVLSICLLLAISLSIITTINYALLKVNTTPIVDPDQVPQWIRGSVPILAGLISTSTFAPQLIKVFKTKQTKNLSYFLMIFYALSLLSLTLFWTLWGIDSAKWSTAIPSVIFTSVPGLVQLTLLSLKIKYENNLSKKSKQKNKKVLESSLLKSD